MKMEWYLGLSVATCATVFIGFLGLLSLTSFHLWNEDEAIPLEESDEWMTLVTALIPISILIMFLSLFFLWTLITKDRMRFFIATLVLNFLCLATMMYFAVTFSNQYDSVQASGETLFAKTKQIISKELSQSGNSTWIPPWLDNIQKHSKICCGIQTFRDWEELWPAAPTQIPSSCCMDAGNVSTFCPLDLSRIPFPGTPTMFIKTDTGCLDEINQEAKNAIHQCLVYTGILCALLALAEIAYLLQFYKQYIPSRESRSQVTPPLKGDLADEDTSNKGMREKGKGDVFGQPGSPDAASYIQLSGFSSGSMGTLQSVNSGIDPDTGSPSSLAFSVTMASYDPSTNFDGDEGTSRGQVGSQRSLGRVSSMDQPQPSIFGGGATFPPMGGTSLTSSRDREGPLNNLSVVSSTSSVDDQAASGTEEGGKKKKKKKKHHHHRHHKDNQDTSAGNEGEDAVVNRQEVNINPDTTSNIDNDFPADTMDDLVTFSNSPTGSASTDDVGDELAEGMRPGSSSPKTASNKDRKGLMSMTRRRRKH